MAVKTGQGSCAQERPTRIVGGLFSFEKSALAEDSSVGTPPWRGPYKLKYSCQRA